MEKRRKTCHLISTSLAVALCTVFICMHCFFPSHASALIDLEEGDTPEAIVLHNLEGEEVDVSVYFGKKPVVILFWKLTTNDAFLNYSLDELRFLNDFYKRLNERTGLEVFAVYAPRTAGALSDLELSAVRTLAASNNIAFPILLDRNFAYFRKYGIIALPSTIMVGTSGRVDFIYSSFPIAARQIVADKINELTGISVPAAQKERMAKEQEFANSNKFYRYALQMYKRGLLEQSLSALKKSIELNPDQSWAYNLKGIILWKKRIADQSAEEFRKALSLDKNNINANINYSVLLIEQGKYDEAETYLRTSVTADPDKRLRIHHLMGIVYMKTGRTDEAVKEMELTLSLFDKASVSMQSQDYSILSAQTHVLHDLSVLYDRAGQKANALETLHRAFHDAFGLSGSLQTEHINEAHDLMVYD